MTQLTIGRRGLLTGLVALVAAPAIVRATSLMPVSSAAFRPNSLLTIDMITREAMRLFVNTNAFIQNIDRGGKFGGSGAKIGTTLRIRLPADYSVQSDPLLHTCPLEMPDTAALAVGAAAIVGNNPPVTRRFWSGLLG